MRKLAFGFVRAPLCIVPQAKVFLKCLHAHHRLAIHHFHIFGLGFAFLARNLRLQRLRIQIEQPFILRLLGQRLFVRVLAFKLAPVFARVAGDILYKLVQLVVCAGNIVPERHIVIPGIVIRVALYPAKRRLLPGKRVRVLRPDAAGCGVDLLRRLVALGIAIRIAQFAHHLAAAIQIALEIALIVWARGFPQSIAFQGRAPRGTRAILQFARRIRLANFSARALALPLSISFQCTRHSLPPAKFPQNVLHRGACIVCGKGNAAGTCTAICAGRAHLPGILAERYVVCPPFFWQNVRIAG